MILFTIIVSVMLLLATIMAILHLRKIKPSDLDKLKKVYDELDIKYHEIIEGDYTYIQKFAAHDQPGFLNVVGVLYPLQKSEQLNDFFEFKNGKLVSW